MEGHPYTEFIGMFLQSLLENRLTFLMKKHSAFLFEITF